MPDTIEPGTVWLVGAGPGDPDLLTRKAEKLIVAADIVFYDALVGPGVLDLIPEHVERVSVGKRSGRHSKDQADIDRLIVEAALSGKRVVRLKGGDPSIFGRATEELDACRAASIPAFVCPGITAASAAAAGAGISLTLRGMARKLVLLTAHTKAGVPLDFGWQTLADPDATLAIYMGRANAALIASKLIEHGMSPATPVLVTADASLPCTTAVSTRLDLLPLVIRTMENRPVVTLIGAAMAAAGSKHLAGNITRRNDLKVD